MGERQCLQVGQDECSTTDERSSTHSTNLLNASSGWGRATSGTGAGGRGAGRTAEVRSTSGSCWFGRRGRVARVENAK